APGEASNAGSVTVARTSNEPGSGCQRAVVTATVSVAVSPNGTNSEVRWKGVSVPSAATRTTSIGVETLRSPRLLTVSVTSIGSPSATVVASSARSTEIWAPSADSVGSVPSSTVGDEDEQAATASASTANRTAVDPGMFRKRLIIYD